MFVCLYMYVSCHVSIVALLSLLSVPQKTVSLLDLSLPPNGDREEKGAAVLSTDA